MPASRRQFLQGAGAAAVGVTILGRAEPLLAASDAATHHFSRGTGYGPLVADPAGLLDLPKGFRYQVVTRAGDRLTDLSGRPTQALVPGAQDGTAAFAGPRGSTVLVVNHEQGATAAFPATAPAAYTYDPKAVGGTSTIHVDRHGKRQVEYVSLAGTWSNCAGGPTPWGTWLTCEETEQKADGTTALRDHGWVFEVDPSTPGHNQDPTPLTALGRFAHEAVAIDPGRGHAYLTEDASGPNGLLYRFTPADRRHRYGAYRKGGYLEAMLVPDLPDLSTETRIGARHRVQWKTVPDPLATSVSTRKQFTYANGATTITGPGGAITRSRKLEGIYWQDGLVHVVASFARLADGSRAEHDGQVWAYDPRKGTIELEVLYAVNTDTASDRPDGPDNITVTPSGGLVLAEDGEGASHVLGVNRWGETFLIARNALNDSEFTGPTFSRDRSTLFVNIQTPGIVLALTGPWSRGSAAL
ncbi:PhoX family protein [Aquihabitans sp. G128]|uniref:alkaline phosphatase PhoX n=1 Tax=Aquihabitans sp. G128 TaxID=2849779 RepID=UPI001C215F33|nr:alkaline phosphatase PhoX [Aquihabitans sp. G128]QXC62703.1 PhoX family protein [Aquihabitans sp. G128]